MLIFWCLIFLMLFFALGFIAWPFIIQGSDNTNSLSQKKSFIFMSITIIATMTIALSWYFYAGNSQKLKEWHQAQLVQQTLVTKTPEEIMKKMQEYVQHHPNDAKAWYLLGRLYQSTGDIVHAKECFEKAKQLQTKSTAV